MIIMYNYEKKRYNPSLVYIDDNILDDIWQMIVSSYKDVLIKHFGIDDSSTILTPPHHEVLKISDISRQTTLFSEILYYMPKMNDEISFVEYPSTCDLYYIKASIYDKYLMIFEDRIHKIFIGENRIYNFIPKFLNNQLIHSLEGYQELCKNKNAIMHFSFTKSIYMKDEFTEESLRDICTKTGCALSKIYKNKESIPNRIDAIEKVHLDGYQINSGFPSQLIINGRSKNCKMVFRTIVFKNGRIVANKKGRAIPYAFTEMQLKLNKLMTETGKADDKWVIINGFIKYTK